MMRSALSWTSRLGALLLLLARAGTSAAELGRWSALGPFGASVAVVAIDPLTPSHVLVYAENDGVFRLAEDGASWTRLDFDASRICSLAAAPGVFFLTTHEPEPNTMWRSTDGGTSWTATALSDPLCDIEIVAVDPRDLDTLYGISSDGGAVRSTDGGETWKPIAAGLVLGGSTRLLVMDSTDPARLFLGVSHGTFADERFHLFVSPDRGETWTYASRGLPAGGADSAALAIDPSAPSTLYLALPRDGVFRSTDGGASWQKLPGSPSDTQKTLALIVDSSRPSNLYLATQYSDIFRSTDGGESWTRLADAVPPHAEVRRLAIDSATPSNLYVGTVFGVRRSADGGDSWSQLNHGFISAGWTRSLAIGPQDPARLYAQFLSRFSGIVGSNDRGASWEWLSAFVVGHPFTKMVVDPQDSSLVYALSPGGNYGGAFRSIDGGRSWQQFLYDNRFHDFVEDLVVDPLDPRFVYVTKGSVLFRSQDRGASWEALEIGGGQLAVDPTTGDLYRGYGRSLYRSRDRALSWSQVAADLTERFIITSLAIAPSNPDVLCAGAKAGDGVYRSEDRGASWARTSMPEHLGSPHELVIDPTDPSIVYAPLLTGVYWTSDSGESWKLLAQDSLNADVYDLALDPSNPHHLYVATQDGIFEIEFFEGRSILELRDGRFLVEVEWRDFRGDSGPGTVAVVPSQASGATDLRSRDSTVVEFFDPENWELLIKVLDGTAINGSFWVFFAAATDVGYTTTVTDTSCGVVRTYVNPLGLAAPAVTDDSAFPGCDAPAPPGCVEDGAVLCLGENGRFQVEIEWSDFMGNSGVARQVRLARIGLAQVWIPGSSISSAGTIGSCWSRCWTVAT